MNEATEDLLLDAVERMQECIRRRECPAIVLLDADDHPLAMSDYDYLRDDDTAAAFEQRAGVKVLELECTRWVFTVPQVWIIRDGAVAARAASNHPLRGGEQEAITWVAFDRDSGFDIGRVAYARRPNGDPVFEDIEVLQVPAQAAVALPGFTLLQTVTDSEQTS